MYKKMISLVLVLALAGVSSAIGWNPIVPVGDWEVGSNWVGGVIPGPTDTVEPYPAGPGGYTAITIYLSSSQSVARVKWQFQTSTLNINSGGTLTNNGSVGSCQMYGDTAATIDIKSGGAFIAKGSNTGIQTGNGTQLITVESGGLLGVYSNSTTGGHLATNAL